MAASAMYSDPRQEVGRMQQALHAVAEDARRIDTRPFEIDTRGRVRAELVPAVREAMGEAVLVLDDVLARYDQAAQANGPESSGVFNCMFEDMVEAPTEQNPRQRIADISFMARWELGRKRDAVLIAERRSDDWQLISQCCSARRRVIKAASGVERVLSQVEALPSVFEGMYLTEKQRAIETRAAYYSFASGLCVAEQRWRDEAIDRCVRLAGVGIARLVGRSIYEELRVEDRRSLRMLQSRLVDWLRGSRDTREAERLIGDVSAFASLLMEVNRRPQLIAHDREVLETLLATVARAAPDKQGFYPVLETIRGRDPKLDRLIDARTDLHPQLWRSPAERVLARLREQDQ